MTGSGSQQKFVISFLIFEEVADVECIELSILWQYLFWQCYFIRTKGDLGTLKFTETSKSPPVILFLTVPRQCFFCGFFCYLHLSLSYCHVCFCHSALWSPVGKGLPIGSLVYDIFLCFLSLSHMVSWVRYAN